jgi:predicted RNA-binding Zn ribbon-like protein
VRIDKFSKYLNASSEDIIKILSQDKEEFVPFKGAEKRIIGFFKSEEEIERFLKSASKLKENSGKTH